MNLVAGTVSGHCIRVSDEGGVCTYGWVVDGGVEDVCGAGGLCVVVVVCGSGCMVVVVKSTVSTVASIISMLAR